MRELDNIPWFCRQEGEMTGIFNRLGDRIGFFPDGVNADLVKDLANNHKKLQDQLDTVTQKLQDEIENLERIKEQI